MSSLQKVVLGTPPKAEDGDPVRTANVKANANVDVLNAQSALTSAAQLVDSAQALTAALHLGRRVNISLAAAGIIQVPTASTCAADGVLLLRNIGTTVVTLAITTGSGDTLSLSKLNAGETALLDTDGVHAWTVLMRGRTNSDNEMVNGNCAVGGNETIAGTLGVTGLTTLTGGASFGSAGQAAISAAGAYSGASAAYTGNVTAGGTLTVTGVTKVGTNAANTAAAALQVSNNQSAVGLVPAAVFANGAANGPGLSIIPNTGAAYFNPIVGANDVLLMPSNGGNGGVNFSICPPGSTMGGMRITADGNISFQAVNIAGLFNGTASADGAGFGIDHGLYIQRKTAAGIWVTKNGSAAGTWDPGLIQFYYNGSQCGSISTPAGASVAFNTTSDYRLKTVSGRVTDALARVIAIPVYRGYYTMEGAEREHDLAFAHEIAERFPNAVTGDKDAVSLHPVFRDGYDPEDVQPDDVLELSEMIVPQQVDYSKLVMPLFAAVQDLKALLDLANGRISALEAHQ